MKTKIQASHLIRPLTEKEKKVLEFLEEYIQDQGIAPSFKEIGDHFGFASLNSVQRYLKQLQTKEYIHIPEGNQKRAISILKSSNAILDAVQELQSEKQSEEVFQLPLLGRVAAGQPIEALDHNEFIDVPKQMLKSAKETYALTVEGQSMIEDGILDGDIIIVDPNHSAHNGSTVVAMVDNEATVKRFYHHAKPNQKDQSKEKKIKPLIELRPANAAMTSLWYEPNQVEIRGLVVGLIRQY